MKLLVNNMLFKKIVKNTQEQAVASWINYLNQVRLDELSKALHNQDFNLETSMKIIDETLDRIKKDIINNGQGRGGSKGMHGFIAEVAECGIGNAREKILGKASIYKWIDDNGPSDLKRGDINIQQKFVNSGGHLSLEAIKMHLDKYPDYLKDGNMYQIPADHYEKVKFYWDLPAEKAYKMSSSNGEFSLRQWKEVQKFKEEGKIPFNKIEPSKLRYEQVQKGKIKDTIDNEKVSLKETDRKIRDNAYEKSQPTFAQGAKAAAASAVIEGGTTFVISIIEVRKTGKNFNEFTEEDWKQIAQKSGYSFAKGGVRGASIYSLTNYTATPAAVASSLVTASFGIAEQAYQFRSGKISEEDFLMNSEIMCLDTTVSALSSYIGQALIPIPVLGAVIGNTVGNVMYQVAKDGLSKYEQEVIQQYMLKIEKLNCNLDGQYYSLVKELEKDLNKYFDLLTAAFACDYSISLEGSVNLAKYIGVEDSEILHNLSEVDSYFLE